MGLFSRKKKEQQRVEEAAAVEKARLEAARAAVMAAEADKKAREQADKQGEDGLVNQISQKRKEIEQMLGAIDEFQKRAQISVRKLKAAKQANKKAEAAVHLRTAKALEKRIKDYEIRIARNQEQLTSLEDTLFQRHGHASNKQYIDSMKASQLDRNEVENVLQDMRETMEQVNDVNLVTQADHNLHGTAVDAADMDDEIARLEGEFDSVDIGGQVQTELPSVPGTMPEMPGAASASDAVNKEEEEIRRLEESIGMA